MAGTSIGTATVNIVPSMKGFTSAINGAVSKVNVKSSGKKLGSSLSDGIGGALSSGSSALAGIFGGVASTITSGLIDAIGGLTSEMVEAADGAQKFASTLDFAGIDTSTIDALTKSTQEYADATVYDLNDIRSVTAQLAANGVSNYAQLAEAAGNLNAVAGGNADTFQSVGQVMTQTAGAGKLMTENWNQLTDAIPGASGALQDAMRDAGAFSGNFREAMENGEISADEFFDAVQKLGLQDVAREAATSTSTIEGALGNLQASVVGVGSQVVGAVTPYITGAVTEISSFISSVPSMVQGVWPAIQQALGGDSSALVTVISGLVTQMGTAIQTGITTLTTQLPMLIQQVLPVLLTSITTLLQSLFAQLPTILTGLLGLAITAITTYVSTLGAQLPTVISQLLPAIVSAVGQLITNIITNIPTWLPMIVQAAVSLFQGFVTGIVNSIPSIIDTVGQLIQSIITNIPTFLGALIDAAVQLFNGIVQAIPQVVPAVLDGISSLLQDVWNAITSFDLLGAGKDLIQGLIDGILSMGGAVLDAIGGVVDGAIDWAKGLLGIGSPSKLFRQFGDWTMQGLALGFDKGSKGAVRSMDSAMRDVLGAASVTASLSLAGAGGYQSAAPMRQQVNNYNVTVDGIGTTGRVQAIVMDLLEELYPMGVM